MIRDIMAALGLLTRLPVPLAPPRPEGAWAWPLAGGAVGALAALAGGAGLGLGLPAGIAAGMALAAGMLATGALHEDGLADCADGFWGGRDKARRLAIMKDSAIGSYGTLALIVTVLVRWQAVTAILAGGDWPLLIAAAALSRAPMAALSAFLPNARGAGLSQSVGRPLPRTAGLSAAAGLGIALATAGEAALPMAFGAALAACVVALVARTKIGGQTGDVLGASQQLAEVGALMAGIAVL
ncbi:MAG: adenosylcobinamide-GDP ribazoletransferase [Paracoccaceae bacterium]